MQSIYFTLFIIQGLYLNLKKEPPWKRRYADSIKSTLSNDFFVTIAIIL